MNPPQALVATTGENVWANIYDDQVHRSGVEQGDYVHMRGEYNKGTFDAYQVVLGDPRFQATFSYSVIVAVFTIILGVLVVVPTAYWIRLRMPYLRPVVEFITLLPLVIPAIVNLSIGILLNTSLLAVIGITDLLNAAKTAATDPNWLGFYTETFLFAACIYFAISFAASRYSLWLEARLRAR